MTNLFDKGKNVYTIPAGVAFMPSLLDGLDHLQASLKIKPADMTVFLPTQRAIQTFKRLMTKRNHGRTTLLPTLKALGTLDEEDLAFSSLVNLAEDLALPPAIAPLKRLFLLQEELTSLPGVASLGPISTRQRLLLAGELAKLLDQVQNEGTDFKAIKNLEVEKELAEHWQGVLDFLASVSKKWPRVLDQKGLIDPVQRRTLLVKKLIETWQINPPKGPVIAAGSTGSVPIIRQLLKAVSALPQGAVIFPGFDASMDLECWKALDENHPQFMMKQTLGEFKLGRDKVQTWPFPKNHQPGILGQRLDFIRQALLPAEATGRWHLEAPEPKNLKNIIRDLNIIDCPTQREEAGVIALVMRHALETKDKRAALITPDRGLARRVKAELKRWDITVEDSAGTPLQLTPPGAFYSICLNMVAEKFSPVATLAFLKHPLARLGMPRQDLLNIAQGLDRGPFRGTRPAPGIKGLLAAVGAEKNLPEKPEAIAFLDALKKAAKGLASLLFKKKVSFADLLKTHMQLADQLSTDQDGTAQIWRGEKGNALADFLEDLQGQASALGIIDGSEYPAIIDSLMQTKKLRPHQDAHPRLEILGTLEARLQNPDLVILGGLNEGTWPPEAAADPWMSREMRKIAGLPTPDQRVGQSAHDFYMAFGASEVVLTRAGKAGGSPATASRWLQRMTALLGREDLSRASDPWLIWYASLDLPETLEEIDPPAPTPKFGLRPRQLSVTNIELLMRDPYAVFAKHILKLKPLDELEADPNAADKGIILHDIFDTFLRDVETPLPTDALDKLLEVGRTAFQTLSQTRPMVEVFWWPRFCQVAEAFIEKQQEREITDTVLATEVSANWRVKGTGHPFTVTAKADRIDARKENGEAVIIDYKTGATYKNTEDITSGRKPQLALEGVMAEAGAFDGIANTPVSALEYWKMGAASNPLEIKFPKKIDVAITIDEAADGIAALVNYFDDPTTPYLATPHPDFSSYGEYDLLARTAEWQNRLKGNKA